MIVSASYRTDIPTFYAEWFRRRFLAGYCLVRNPYSGQPYRVSLKRDDVSGMVFWTRNVRPFQENLHLVHEAGIPFTVTCTVNDYPRILETSVIHTDRAVADLRAIAERYGPWAGVWRYDPVIVTSLTPPAFHEENFAALAAALQGAVNEVVVSFAQIYQKSERNLNRAAETSGLAWQDPDDTVKRGLLERLAAIAAAHGLRISLCAQRHLLVDGVQDARCIDAGRLSRVAGRQVTAAGKPHRDRCGCFESRDIGDYDTCPHGCVYCYAVRSRRLALKRHQRHDPNGEMLCP